MEKQKGCMEKLWVRILKAKLQTIRRTFYGDAIGPPLLGVGGCKTTKRTKRRAAQRPNRTVSASSSNRGKLESDAKQLDILRI